MGSMERIFKFDIFSGSIDKNALWLERAEGRDNENRRMDEIATKSPGKYFVFCDFFHIVIAQTDTSCEIPSEGTAVQLSEVGTPEGTSNCGAAMRHETQLTSLGCSRIEGVFKPPV